MSEEKILEEVKKEISDIVVATMIKDKVYCDICGKCCTSDDGETIIGQSWEVQCAETNIDFVQHQLGEYKPNHRYYVCWECSLKVLGVKP